jgi:uncharacterized protein (TIGR03790 family)
MNNAWFTLAMLVWANAWAFEPGSEVIVLYNNRVPESKGVAQYYARERQVPPDQIFGFDLPTQENMTRQEFREDLQKPLAKKLESKKLWHIAPQRVPGTNNQPPRTVSKVVQSNIRYAVLAYGMPLRILDDPILKEAASDSARPELQRNGAAVDTELALLPAIDRKPPLNGPLLNPMFGTTNLAWFYPSNGVLMVTRLDGPNASIARGLVDKAREAEKTGLWGRAYFDLRNISDAAYKPGDDMIRAAGEICRSIGFETVVDENAGTFSAAFPMSQIAFYAGWYTEHANGPFSRQNVEFMPGAFAYHLHSFSANTLRNTSNHWVGPLLAKGATITMGTIDEPYLSATPDISVFASRFLAAGMTFGEAAYAAQPVLSWQTTIVGDPLYRAFRKPLDEMARELDREKNKLAEWSYLRLLNSYHVNGRSLNNVVGLLENIPVITTSAVLTEKLAELYLAQGKPASAIHAYQQALNRHPSAQQRLRLRLRLGERLLAQAQDAEAYDNYQKMLMEFADYPDKQAVYKKLVTLAHKLNKTAEAERYENELKPEGSVH